MHAEEGTFHAAVERYLQDTFDGYDALGHEVRLPHSDRRADFIVTLGTPGVPAEQPNIVVAVEVENDWEAVFGGVGQVECYAAHFEHGVPVLAFPAGTAEQPELRLLRSASPVQFLEVPHDYDHE